MAALSDPTRQRIIELLASGARSSGEIARHFDISAPAVSQHLRTLRAAQLVQVRVDAQRRIYALDPRGVNDVAEWIARIRKFWAPRLDALETELRNEAGKEPI